MNMVERVARAIQEAQQKWLDDNPQHDNGAIYDEDWSYVPSEVSARAAIQAMREPTVEMLDATGSGECGKWAPGAWNLMIDAALKE